MVHRKDLRSAYDEMLKMVFTLIDGQIKEVHALNKRAGRLQRKVSVGKPTSYGEIELIRAI